MIKDIEHIRLRHSLACKRVIKAIDNNPDIFKGLKIPPKEVIVNDNSQVRNLTLYGLLVSIALKVFH